MALTRTADGACGAGARLGRSRRRWRALALSLLLHGSFALMALGTMKGALVSGGSGDPEGEVGTIDLSLAGLKGAARALSAEPSSQAMASIFRKIRAEQSDLVASDEKPRPQGDLQKLFDVIDEEKAAKDQAAGGPGRSRLDEGGKGSTPGSAHTDAAERKARPSDVQRPGGAGAAVSTGDLWGQIKPCWDQLPPVATVPVTLVIALDNRGRIAKPPLIVRPNSSAPNERRLVSEARALAAVTACVPYRLTGIPGFQQTFTVRFVGG